MCVRALLGLKGKTMALLAIVKPRFVPRARAKMVAAAPEPTWATGIIAHALTAGKDR